MTFWVLEATVWEVRNKWFSAYISVCKSLWLDWLSSLIVLILSLNSPSRNHLRNTKKMEEKKADLTSLEGCGTTVAPKYPEKGKGEFAHTCCGL